MPEPSLLLIHGAATGAWVWRLWRRELAALGWQANVLDLRGHGMSVPTELETVTMEDYLADVASVASQIAAAQGVHPIMGGWSLGGMLAMMYASGHPETPALLLMEPNMPVEVAGKASVEYQRRFSAPVLEPEVFGVIREDPGRSREALFDLSEAELTDFLTRSAGAAESGIAFRQCLRGISVPQDSIGCPTLVLYGDHESRLEVAGWSRGLASHLGGETLTVPGAGHWGIVAHGPMVAAAAVGVDGWLRRSLGSEREKESANGT
jgi:pimeloyl-ACP methyl ester carboxylesterase